MRFGFPSPHSTSTSRLSINPLLEDLASLRQVSPSPQVSFSRRFCHSGAGFSRVSPMIGGVNFLPSLRTGSLVIRGNAVYARAPREKISSNLRSPLRRYPRSAPCVPTLESPISCPQLGCAPLTMCGHLEIPHHSATRMVTGLPLSECQVVLSVVRGRFTRTLTDWCSHLLYPCPRIIASQEVIYLGQTPPLLFSPGKNIRGLLCFSWPELLHSA